MNPKIIGISGNMGAGKTTLAKALALDLRATMLGWDDFDDISTGPVDYVEWYHRGQNYNEWDYQTLATVLELLKAKKPVSHPVSGHSLQPTDYIIFDAPLGRKHSQTGQYIDICIHITVPLDISLCRHLLRDFKDNNKTKEDLLSELDYYLLHSRPLFFDDDLKESADFIIDGLLPINEQIKIINEYLKRGK